MEKCPFCCAEDPETHVLGCPHRPPRKRPPFKALTGEPSEVIGKRVKVADEEFMRYDAAFYRGGEGTATAYREDARRFVVDFGADVDEFYADELELVEEAQHD